MIKKIISVLLVAAALWFFIDRTVNYGTVNMNKTAAANYSYRLNWMDRR